MCLGVVPAEEQFTTGGERYPKIGLRATTITAIRSGQGFGKTGTHLAPHFLTHVSRASGIESNMN